MSAHGPNSSTLDPRSPVAADSEGPARLEVHSVGTPDVGRPLMSHFRSRWKDIFAGKIHSAALEAAVRMTKRLNEMLQRHT